MAESAEILEKIGLIFGEQWWEKRRVVGDIPGHVDVFLDQEDNGVFSIAQHWDIQGVYLPAPQIVFRWEGPSKSVQVISWEDWLDDDSPEVKRKFETIEGKDRIERKLLKVELNQRLLDYLKEWERFAKGG